MRGAVLLLLVCCCLCRGLRLDGELIPRRGSADFAGKFCFGAEEAPDKEAGKIFLSVHREHPHLEPRQGILYFMIYDDDHWMAIRDDWLGASCQQKINASNLITEVKFEQQAPEFKHKIPLFERARPRFWYFTFVSCNGFELQGASLSYRIHAVNVNQDWQREFSYDHKGVMELHAVSTIAFGSIFFLAVWASWCRPTAEMLKLRDHPYVQLLLLTLLCSLASSFFLSVHYVMFMYDGSGDKSVRFLAVLAAVVANCTVFLIAMLSSQGWAVTTFALEQRRLFLAGIALVGGLSGVTELHAEVTIDQSTQLYVYQSFPGACSLVTRLLMFAWYAHQIKTTCQTERQERVRQYYLVLTVVFSVWCINSPVSVVLAFSLDPWVRFRVVALVDNITRFFGLALLVYVLCGPPTPISSQNTFTTEDHISSRDLTFDRLLDDSVGDDL